MVEKRLTSPYMVEGRDIEIISPKDQSPLEMKLPPEIYTTIQMHLTGKLLLKDELQLEKNLFQLLCKKQYLTRYKAITIYKNSPICMRCDNQQRKYFAEIKCVRCQSVHYYCRSCIMMGRVLQCEYLYEWSYKPFHWEKIKQALQWDGILSNAQGHAAEQIGQAMRNHTEQLVWAVTGAGKTEMLFPAMNEALSIGKRICITSPRVDVVKELLPRFKRAFPNVNIEGLYSNSEHKTGCGQIMITTTHQLLRFKHAFDFIVIDEVDAFPYYLDASLQFAVRRARKKQSTTIYLTATPRKEFLTYVKRHQIHTVFVPVRYHKNPLIVPKTMYIHRLQYKLQNNIPIKKLQKWLLNRKVQTRQILIFMPTIVQVTAYRTEFLAFLLKNHLINEASELQSVHANDVQREEKIKQFRNKEIKVLLTTTILERGVTFPSVDVIVLGADHIVFDRAALVQIAGRAGRSQDDPNGHVLYVHEGLTNAMIEANEMIRMMNKKRREFLRSGRD